MAKHKQREKQKHIAPEPSSSATIQTILRWGIYACAFLVPLLIFKDYLSPFHFGKVIVFRAMVEILAVFYVILLLSDRSFVPKRNLFFWSFTAFTIAFGIASIASINAYQSVMGTLERMGGWFTFLHFWVFVMMMMSVLRTREDWMMLIKVSVFAGLLSTIYGFLQKTDLEWVVGGGARARIFGTIGNAALFAGYIIVNMFFSLFLVFQSKSAEGKVLFGFIFILNLIAVLMTAVRGSILAILVSFALFAVMYSFLGTSKQTRTYIGAFAGLLIILELLLIAGHNTAFVKKSAYLTRLSDASLSTRTVDTRFWAWQAGFDGWNDSAKTMLVGWGPENFNVPFSLHFNPKFFSGPGAETLFDRAHNMFVEILVTMGVFGIAAYVAIFVTLFMMLRRLYKKSTSFETRLGAITLVAGLVAYIIHNSFIFDTSANFLVFVIMGCLIQFLYSSELEKEPVSAKVVPTPATLRYSAGLLAAVVAIILIYKTDMRPAFANYATTRGIVASWGGDQVTALAKFKQALDYNTFPIYDIRHRYAQYVLENFPNFTKEQGLNPGEILYATAEEVKKNTTAKLDYLPYLYVSRIYIVLGKGDPKSPFNDLALENSLKARDIAPKFVRTYFEIGQAYLNKHDYPNAVAMFKTAVDLNPEVAVSWWYLGVTQIESGDLQGGGVSVNKAIALGYDYNNEQDLVRLLAIYDKLSDVQKLIEILEKLTAMKPNDPKYYPPLANVYGRAGRIDDAVRTARKAAELDPSYEPQAKTFVESLGRTW